MSRLISILLLLILQFPLIVQLSIYIDFKAHQDFISDVLCIEKDEPISMCNGSCYLDIQLQKVEASSPESPTEKPKQQKQKVESLLFWLPQLITEINPIISLFKKEKSYNAPLSLKTFVKDIFRPPQKV